VAPDDPFRQVLLIQSYAEARRLKEAIAAAIAARQKFPDETSILYQLGAAYDRAGQAADAEKTFRELLQHDPLDANALNYLGYMFADRGRDLEEAVSLIQRALKIDPANPSYLDSLGWAYLHQGHFDLADAPLTKAADTLPKNSVVQDHLGDLRIKQHRPAEAIAAWQRALAGDGEEIDPEKIRKKIKDAQSQLKR
jgi:Flp pilus assembly protein TadD